MRSASASDWRMIGALRLIALRSRVLAMTNHVPKGVTARHYLETSYLQYLRPEVQRIADWFVHQARIAKDMETGGNVVALRA